jgi:NADH:ubiquinone oxidoreductase subunit 6 (subunit J)
VVAVNRRSRPEAESSAHEGAQRRRAAYVSRVKTFLVILLALLMLGTLGVLFAGLIGMVRGGGDPRKSNALMRWRVILQAAALLLFALLMGLLRS